MSEVFDYIEKIKKRLSIKEVPIFDVELLNKENINLYITRPVADNDIKYFTKNILKGSSTNIMISGRAGIGKSTFVHYYFNLVNPEFHYLRIDMTRFFRSKTNDLGAEFLEDEFYLWTYRELNNYLKEKRNIHQIISQESLESNPRMHFYKLLHEYYNKQDNGVIFLFLDNIDVRPKELHLISLESCIPLLTAPGIVVIFASRRQFRDYIMQSLSHNFFTEFRRVIDLYPINFEEILSVRLKSVATEGFIFPFEQQSLIFLEAFSNGNLRAALRATEGIIRFVLLNNLEIPINREVCIEAIYALDFMPKIYEKMQMDDYIPIRLAVLHHLRQYKYIDNKFYYKMTKILKFNLERIKVIENEMIENRLFDRIKIDDNNYLIQITSRGGEVCKMIDDGSMYQLYLKYDVPRAYDEKMTYKMFKDNFWADLSSLI